MNTRRLIVQTGDSTRELLFIGRLTVGRATECDISLNDGKVSRRHAELDATGPVPRITDLGSRNGLLVNGKKVASAELHPGDVIVIGDARIVVDVVDETIAAPGFDGAASAGGDRTAIIEMPSASGEAVPPPAIPAAPPPVPAPAVPPPAAPVEAAHVPPASPPPQAAPQAAPAVPEPAAAPPSDDDDRTAVLPRPVSASQVVPVLPKADDDERTAVIPREAMAPPVPATPPPPAPVAAPAPVPAARTAAEAAPVPIQTNRQEPGDLPLAASPPAGTPASTSGATAAGEAPVALAGPRFSWRGMVMLLCVGLGALAMILAAVPLLSSSAQLIDALSTRQARTLVTWLGDGAGRDDAPTTAEAIVQAVLSQDGVLDALVLDAATGQVVAPIRQAGTAIGSVPGAGEDWRRLGQIRVVATGDVVDALLPFSRAGTPHVAWVRYAKPSTSERSVALVVALIATLVLGFVASLLIRRHTVAVLGLFTRQVELAVSGVDTRVMQGSLVPGLERLPGIVAYLLEQRKAGSATASGTAPRRDRAPSEQASPVDEPAWIVATPSLTVQETSTHAPSSGVRNWASGAQGQHLLDVLEPGALCNAVVQGLGALSNAPGADMTVPVSGRAPVTLRREAGGNVRIILPLR